MATATATAAGGSLTARDRQILAAVNTGASSLSLMGSTFIVLCYLLFKDLRKFSFKLVFFLALSVSLSLSLSLSLLQVSEFMGAEEHKTDVEDLEPVFHLYVWGTSLVMTIMRSIGNHHSHIRVWCWSQAGLAGKAIAISILVVQVDDMDKEWVDHACIFFYEHPAIAHESVLRCQSYGVKWSPLQGPDIDEISSSLGVEIGKQDNVVHFATFYVPLWGAILYNGLTYLQVIRMLKNATRMAAGMSDRAHQFDGRADMRALNRWGYYPLILIGSWAFGTINRIHDFIEPGHKIFWLSFLDVGTAALMGLFNSIAYGLNSSVRRAIYERLDLFWPERLRRWTLPVQSSKFSGPQQESELVPLKIQEQRQ
ncbi:hypothetical protein Cgig2_033789 [Carnegiea gigantea]|uniref:G-protein coupled receptors family 2 profile 2 domain-containing protein n=1 Tax=Carnegiea gigantea TaxID=171969 RepID=A0A9Q1GNL5_9CARY|nr:hypothetical protein Cgig2_033789 [Carnegiea gigantea]